MDPTRARAADDLKRQFPSLSLAEAYSILERNKFNMEAAVKEVRSSFVASAGDHGVMYEMPPSTGVDVSHESEVGAVVEELFRKGGREGGSNPTPEPQAFFGSGRRLGHTEMASPVIPAVVRQVRTLTVAVYRNEIRVGSPGEVLVRSIPTNTPEANRFMREMQAGVLPRWLEAQFPGSDFDIQLQDCMDRDHEPPARPFEAFQDEGKRLGTSPAAGANGEPCCYDGSRTFRFDESAERTVVRLVNSTGQQTEHKVNPAAHTVEDLYFLAHQVEPTLTNFVLEVRDMPPRKLGPETRAQTISEAKLKRAVVVMRPL